MKHTEEGTKQADTPVQVRLLTVAQTAKVLGISPITIYAGICRRAHKRFPIRPIKVGGAIRFDMQDIDAYIAKQKLEPNAQDSVNEE